MLSMAATSRVMMGSLESVSISSGSTLSFRNQVHVFPGPRPRDGLKQRSRILGSVKIRAVNSSSAGSGLEDDVNKTISENSVVVYSKTWCGYSSKVKSLFKMLGVEPFVVELDKLGSQGSKLQKTLEKLTGQSTVPNVFIGAKHIGGCSDTVQLHQKGELQSLLLEAGATKLK